MSGDLVYGITRRLFWVLVVAACFVLGIIGANSSESTSGVLGGLGFLGLAAIYFGLWPWGVRVWGWQLSHREYRLLRLGGTAGVTLFGVSWTLLFTSRVAFWTGECVYWVGGATMLLVGVLAGLASGRNKRLHQG